MNREEFSRLLRRQIEGVDVKIDYAIPLVHSDYVIADARVYVLEGDEFYSCLLVHYSRTEETVVVDSWSEYHVGQLSTFEVSQTGRTLFYTVEPDDPCYQLPPSKGMRLQYNFEHRTIRCRKIGEGDWKKVNFGGRLSSFREWCERIAR